MKEIITKNNYSNLLKRFDRFSDSLIRSIEMKFNNQGTIGVSISLETRDALSTANNGWVSVLLFLDMVSEMGIQEHQNTTISIISFGIHILFIDNKVLIEFGGEIDEPNSLEELRKSDAYAIGKSLSLEVFPYVQ